MSQTKAKKWRKEIVGGVIHFHRLTKVKFKKGNKNKSKKQTYDEWWSERNLDGSFAYNGVTDDF